MILRVLLMLLAGVIQYQIWWSPQGYSGYTSLYKERIRQESINQQTQDKINDLEYEVKIKKDNEIWAETEARESFGMVKKDETFYIIEPNEKH